MKGRAFLAFLVMLLLFAAAFGIGAYRGYLDEKLQVELALSSLNEVLTSRVEMGHNLLTVASRHLGDDEPLLASLREQIAILSGTAGLNAKSKANAQLAGDSKALLAKLEGTESLQNDQRDYRYVTGLLPRGFEQSAQWTDEAAYNAAARDYNQRLLGTVNGFAARMLGIEPAEYFGVQGGSQ